MKKQISILFILLSSVFCTLTSVDAWPKEAQIKGSTTNGNIVVFGPKRSEIQDSGISATGLVAGVSTNTEGVELNAGNIDAIIGNISNSYVIVTGTLHDGIVPFSGMWRGSPQYLSANINVSDGNDNIWSVLDQSGDPFLITSPSYLPPHGPYEEAVGTKTCTVEWFSGQDSTKVDAVDGVASNLTVSGLYIDTTETPAWKEGQISFDESHWTALVDTSFTNVRGNVCFEDFVPVYNDSGITITNGKVVNASGNTNITIGAYTHHVFKGKLADSSSPITSSVILGFATHNIPAGTVGVVTSRGEVHDMGTSHLTGGPVYASTNGDTTSVRPTHPGNIVIVGGVVKFHATEGVMFVEISRFTRQTVVTTAPFSSTGTGSGSQFIAGSYDWASDDVTLTQVVTNDTIGTAGIATGAHVGICAAGGATVDAGTVGIRVYGTSITDDGVLTVDDMEVLTTNIVSLSANQYLETEKNWAGQPDIQTYVTSGSPTTWSIDMNDGWSAYIDAANQDFTLTSLRTEGICGQTDTDFNLTVYHHRSDGWTYAATGFEPGNGMIADFETTYGAVYSNISNGKNFKFKLVDLNIFIDGSSGEGYLIEATTGNNKSVQFSNTTISSVLEGL